MTSMELASGTQYIASAFFSIGLFDNRFNSGTGEIAWLDSLLVNCVL